MQRPAARATKIRTLADRVANRAARHLPGKRVDIAPTAPLVSFTFDDCPDTALHNGAAILEDANARGTFYIAGGLVGTRERERTLITRSGVAELAGRGHEVASHTWSHTKLGALSGRELDADLDHNEAFLDGVLGTTGPRNFATPYALTTPFAQRHLRQRYLTSRGGRAVVNRGPTDPSNLGGVEVGAIRPSLETLLPFVDDAVATPGWLIFFTHDITGNHTPWGTTPALLSRLVDAVLKRGCAIVTVDEALHTLGVREELAGRLDRAA